VSLYFKSLNQSDKEFAGYGKQTQHHDDVCNAHVDVHVHDVPRPSYLPVSLLIQFDSFRIPDREARAGIPVLFFGKGVLREWKKRSLERKRTFISAG
jgi:hypothetical protein